MWIRWLNESSDHWQQWCDRLWWPKMTFTLSHLDLTALSITGRASDFTLCTANIMLLPALPKAGTQFNCRPMMIYHCLSAFTIPCSPKCANDGQNRGKPTSIHFVNSCHRMFSKLLSSNQTDENDNLHSCSTIKHKVDYVWRVSHRLRKHKIISSKCLEESLRIVVRHSRCGC